MSTGVVNGGAVVGAGTVVGAVVSKGMLVGGGAVVLVLVVVLVVVVLAISGGSPSASIGVAPSSAPRLHPAIAIESPQSAAVARRVAREFMPPPSEGARRIGRHHLDGPRPTPLLRARSRARRRAPGRV